MRSLRAARSALRQRERMAARARDLILRLRLNADMPPEGARHLSKERLDDIEPGAMYGSQHVLEAIGSFSDSTALNVAQCRSPQRRLPSPRCMRRGRRKPRNRSPHPKNRRRLTSSSAGLSKQAGRRNETEKHRTFHENDLLSSAAASTPKTRQKNVRSSRVG